MKRIILICFLSCFWFISRGQTDYPQKQNIANTPTTLGITNSMKANTGFINGVYADTGTANLDQYFKNYNGAQIATYSGGVKFWIRYNGAWNLISGGGSGASDSAAVLKQVSQIATFARTDVNQISVIDTLRGGTFFRYTGSDAVDNGMIFADANGTKWLRQTYGIDFINVNWYGAYAYTNYTDDMSPYFDAAISYINKHQATYRKLYCPANYNTPSNNQWYLIKNTIELQNITLIGDGAEKEPFTLFQVWYHTTAFSLPALNQAGSPNSVNVSNIKVRHYYDDVPGDSSSHSFDIHCFVNFENVYVMENSQGNAFNIVACAGVATSDPTYGNADQSYFRGCKANLSINGFWIEGCDANVINFINCDASVNKRWGVYDGGMLGNRFYNFHWAGNGNQDNTGCIYGGRYYYPVDGLDNTGKSPLLYPSYWYEIDAIGYVTAWDTTKRYWSGGTAIVSNVNAWTMFHGCYIESSQPPLILNGRSTFVEGTPGSTVYGGIWERTLNATKIFTTGYNTFKSGVQVDRLSVNQTPDADYMLNVTGATYQLARLTSQTTLGQIRMENSSGSGFGGMSSYNDQLLMAAGGDYRLQIDGTGIYPWTNNAITLGRPSYRYSGIYSFLPSGVGDKAVRYNSATGQFTYADTTTASGGSPAGNFGNIQLNRGGLFVAAGSDSLNFNAGLQIKGTLTASALTNAYGDKQVRWNSSTGVVSYIDTLADFTLANGSHFLPDSLLIPVSANSLKVRSLQAGSGITLSSNDSSVIITASGGAGMAIGGTITSGTATRMLFVGTNGLLQQRSLFTFDSTNVRLFIGTSTGTGVLNLAALSGNTDFTLQNTQTWGLASTAAGNAAFYESGGNTPLLLEHAAADNMIRISGSSFGVRTASPTSTMYVNGSFGAFYSAKTSTYTATSTDYTIDCTSGTFTVNLPASSGIAGRVYVIKNSGAGVITVDANSSETIDGATTYSLASQYKYVTIQSDGTNWIVIANN